MTDTLPHVVIVGGGFGGLYAARALKRAPVRITLIDRRNHHVFQPLLYQVASAALNASEIASPIRAILRRQKNATVLLADVVSISSKDKRVLLVDGEISFDYLILATGATHSYFGHDEWAKHAPGLKSIEDALEIRRRIFLAYEAAERETDPERRREWMTFAIIGAGPTGVELAGALAEISRHALESDFRYIDPRQARIILVEGLPRVLPTYPEELSEKAAKQLKGLGVEVRTNARVTAIDEHGLSFGAERLAARTVLWGAGVQASPIAKSLGVPLDKAGRVKVEKDLTIPGNDAIYVIGDLASLEENGKMVPGVAPAAMQGGAHAAKNILRSLAKEERLPFHYKDKGSLATIGRGAAVADFGKVKLSGLLAWLAWLFIHLLFLIGFRNRALALFHWGWTYLTYQRGARLITGEVGPLLEGKKHEGSAPPSEAPTKSDGETQKAVEKSGAKKEDQKDNPSKPPKR